MKINKMKIFVNLITISRLIFTFVLLILLPKLSSASFLIFITMLFSTDFVDGALARRFNVQSFFGSWLDTIADKTLNIAIIIPLFKISKLYYLIIISELVILLINIIAFLRKKMIETLMLGKIKMWLVYLTVILGYLNIFNSLSISIVEISIYLTTIIELAVIISYAYFEILGKNSSTFKFQKDKMLYCLFDTDYYKENK